MAPRTPPAGIRQRLLPMYSTDSEPNESIEVFADALDEVRLSLPEEPGIYKYRDVTGKIIYVGKARNLRRRVNSYFTRGQSHDYKTQMLIRRIHSIEFVVTNTEMEALLLENNLIKQHQPKYNIALRDGKSYPYICVTSERFPRVFVTRKRVKDGSTYFGPYPTSGALYTLMDFIRKNYKLRNCTYHLSEANVKAGKFRPCLEHQIGNCHAPCVGKQSFDDYEEDIRQIRQILRGAFKTVQADLKSQQDVAVADLQFERAHVLKTRIDHLQKYRLKNTVVSDTIEDVEIVTALSEENLTVVNYFKIQNGAIMRTHAFDVWRRNGESELDVLAAVMSYLASEDADFSPKVYVNVELTDVELPEQLKITIPTRGDILKVMQLSVRNCEEIIREKINISRIRRKESAHETLLKQVQKDLRLVSLPMHIECFDNSNIQGYAPVSSCVVFRDGKPSRRDYRVYNVQTVEGADDFATMYEVVHRRYAGLLRDSKALPDLIVIDGGKGQLASALRALDDLGVETQIPVLGIAKRLEEIYYKNDPTPLYIDKKSDTLRLLQRIRNEAHETAINFHRKKRDEKTLKTSLTEIKGVGESTSRRLLTELKSVKRIREADLDTLAGIIGPSKAQVVYAFFHAQEA